MEVEGTQEKIRKEKKDRKYIFLEERRRRETVRSLIMFEEGLGVRERMEKLKLENEMRKGWREMGMLRNEMLGGPLWCEEDDEKQCVLEGTQKELLVKFMKSVVEGCERGGYNYEEEYEEEEYEGGEPKRAVP